MKNLIAILIITASASAQYYYQDRCEVSLNDRSAIASIEETRYATCRGQAIPTAYSTSVNNFWNSVWESKPAEEPQVIINNNYYR